MMSALAEQCQTIGVFGYWKCRDQADILRKITETRPFDSVGKETYIAGLHMIGERKSTTALDYFVCQGKAGLFLLRGSRNI